MLWGSVTQLERKVRDLGGSVVNRLSEPDCSPHPLDIVAIYALYQTR